MVSILEEQRKRIEACIAEIERPDRQLKLAYAADDERRVQVQGAVRDWVRSGLLTAEQAAAVEPDLRTGLRRCGLALRLGLAVFTAMAIGAAAAARASARRFRVPTYFRNS